MTDQWLKFNKITYNQKVLIVVKAIDNLFFPVKYLVSLVGCKMFHRKLCSQKLAGSSFAWISLSHIPLAIIQIK